MQILDFVMIIAVIVYFHALVINMAQKYNVLSLSDFCRSCVMPTRFLQADHIRKIHAPLQLNSLYGTKY